MTGNWKAKFAHVPNFRTLRLRELSLSIDIRTDRLFVLLVKIIILLCGTNYYRWFGFVQLVIGTAYIPKTKKTKMFYKIQSVRLFFSVKLDSQKRKY